MLMNREHVFVKYGKYDENIRPRCMIWYDNIAALYIQIEMHTRYCIYKQHLFPTSYNAITPAKCTYTMVRKELFTDQNTTACKAPSSILELQA